METSQKIADENYPEKWQSLCRVGESSNRGTRMMNRIKETVETCELCNWRDRLISPDKNNLIRTSKTSFLLVPQDKLSKIYNLFLWVCFIFYLFFSILLSLVKGFKNFPLFCLHIFYNTWDNKLNVKPPVYIYFKSQSKEKVYIYNIILLKLYKEEIKTILKQLNMIKNL